MKSLSLALLAALTISAGSGCCLLDHCLGHHCGYGGGCDPCCDEACSYCGPHCGACGCCGGDCSCPPGGCGPGGCAKCESAPATARKPVMRQQTQPMMEPHEEPMPAGYDQYDQSVTQASHIEGEYVEGEYGGDYAGPGYADYAGGGYVDGGCAHATYVPTCLACRQCGGPCGHCGNCCPLPNCRDGRQAVADQLGGPPGPPCGQVTYPYYTTRGPRDFLLNNPPRIGP